MKQGKKPVKGTESGTVSMIMYLDKTLNSKLIMEHSKSNIERIESDIPKITKVEEAYLLIEDGLKYRELERDKIKE